MFLGEKFLKYKEGLGNITSNTENLAIQSQFLAACKLRNANYFCFYKHCAACWHQLNSGLNN